MKNHPSLFAFLIYALVSFTGMAEEIKSYTLTLARARYGHLAVATMQELNQLMAKHANSSELDKLIVINAFMNQHIDFVEDIDLWDVTDYWATPLESLGRHAGDCEDYSIAKYVFLKKMNIAPDKLRLTYVRASLTEYDVRAHMVLAYYETPNATPLIISAISVFDVPLPGVVRSVHMYYLPIAAGSSLVFRKEGIYLRVIFPLLMLLGCLIFGSSDIGITQAYLIANPEIRAVGAWMNNLAALGVLGIALIVMQSDITLRSGLYADMREALAKGHFCLHYQPQVDAQGHIFGAEALLRWQHPERGLIPPGVFITAAEETGLILPIGNWVLKEACAQLVKWSDHPHLSHLSVAVNVSTSQLRQPDFVQEVQEIVTRSGANPGQIKLELTESMLANEVDDTIQKMRALQAFGMSWSLDDFGTGYSSLNYLKHLPFEQLKIDQSFVRDLLNNESDQAIVDTLVNLGKHLKMTLIAEGVETIEQLEYLHSKGCMKYQGYFFSKPLTVQAFEQLPSPLLSPVAHSTSGLF